MTTSNPQELMHLQEAAHQDAARRKDSVLVIDVEDSTPKMASEVEASWAYQIGWLYDNAAQHLKEAGLFDIALHKYLGDGIMICVPEEHATELVNLAIAVLEDIWQNGPDRKTGNVGKINFNCSMAIVTGSAIHYRTPDDREDCTSLDIATAWRLCGAATPKALFIDRNTQLNVIGGKIHSVQGQASRRTPDEYFGELLEVPLKGVPTPLPVFEILWQNQRYGLRAEKAAPRADQQHAARPRPSEIHAVRPQRLAGTVKIWRPDAGFGFIALPDGEDHYFNEHLLAYPEDVKDVAAGQAVAFLSLPPSVEGQQRRAGMVLFDQTEALGTVSAAPTPEHNYGWITVTNDQGLKHGVWVAGANLPADIATGAEVRFDVKVTPRGASAVAVSEDTASIGVAA
jgi:cold shock CspA family protein